MATQTITSTAAERVARYRERFGDKRYDYVDRPLAAQDALGVTIENLLDSIAAGDTQESVAWGQLLHTLSYKYRDQLR
jgi:hypothetical protein